MSYTSIMTQRGLKTGLLLAYMLPFSLDAAIVAEIEGNNLVSTAQLIAPAAFTAEFVSNVESSTSFKHATITASGDGTVDWFTFNHTGGRLILDIDGAMPTIDLELAIWDLSGTLITQNDDGGILDPGTVHGYDSYIDILNQVAGLYYIAVSAYPSGQTSGFNIGGGGFTTSGYTLNISSGAVPEPGAVMLLSLASVMLAFHRRR
jgi:hypothetical protein